MEHPSWSAVAARFGRTLACTAWGLTIAIPCVCLAQAPAPAAKPPTEAPQKPAQPTVEELDLETTDGVQLRAWYYPATLEEGDSPVATVILLHDLEGSHKSVEPLAKGLQTAGCAVVTPDLRGHGESTGRGAGENLDVKLLKKSDFERMAAARGGQIRDQSAVRGDVEAVRNWIKQKAEAKEIDMDRLFIVGSGLGAAVAAAWTTEDWNWPPTAKGPQGQQVRGLVLISPTWTTRGFSISPALAGEAVKQATPVMVIAGKNDRDAGKVFEQLKRQRPNGWYEQHPDRAGEKAPKLDDAAKASLFLFEFDSTRTADALASDRTLNAAAVIGKFFTMALDRPKK